MGHYRGSKEEDDSRVPVSAFGGKGKHRQDV